MYDRHNLLLERRLSSKLLCILVNLALTPDLVCMQHPTGQVLLLALTAGDR